MNRKRTLIVLILALVMLLSTMSTALAAYCMNCGVQLPDIANYCYSCGFRQNGAIMPGKNTATAAPTATPTVKPTATPTARPTATPKPTATPYYGNGLEITRITNNQNGTVTVRWDDSNSGAPYSVYNVQMRSEDFNEDLEISTGFWTCVEDTTVRNATIDNLVPGQNYWIVVADKNGDYVYEPYYGGIAPRFSEFNTDISIQLKFRRNNAYDEVSSFSSSDIARNSANTTYGAYIRLDYPRLARQRNYTFMVAITAPNGEVIVETTGDMELSSGRSYTYWNYYSLDWYFSILTEYFGTVPAGTYTWSLYYDGMFVSSQNFRITN